jgi:hypothetical protein
LTQYWIKFDVLTGAVDGAATGVWLDAFAVSGDPNPFYEWFVSDPGISQAVTGTFSVTIDDGAGTPDPTYVITRSVDMTAVQT